MYLAQQHLQRRGITVIAKKNKNPRDCRANVRGPQDRYATLNKLTVWTKKLEDKPCLLKTFTSLNSVTNGLLPLLVMLSFMKFLQTLTGIFLGMQLSSVSTSSLHLFPLLIFLPSAVVLMQHSSARWKQPLWISNILIIPPAFPQ